MCPYKAGDVIWHIYGMPGGDWLPRLVLSVNGDVITSFDPFLNRDVDDAWRENDPVCQKCGDTGHLRRGNISDDDLSKFEARAAKVGLTLSFRT